MSTGVGEEDDVADYGEGRRKHDEWSTTVTLFGDDCDGDGEEGGEDVGRYRQELQIGGQYCPGVFILDTYLCCCGCIAEVGDDGGLIELA